MTLVDRYVDMLPGDDVVDEYAGENELVPALPESLALEIVVAIGWDKEN